MRVRLAEVAAAAGVSVATASRVLSGARGTSAHAVAAVNAAAERLGYRPDPVARAMRAQTTGLVGLVVPGVSNPFFAEVVEALEFALSESELEIILADSRGTVEDEARRIRTLVDRKVDGLVVIPSDYEASADALRWAQRSCPVVQIDRQVAALEADYVGVDNAVGIRALLEHVRAMGAERVVLVSDRALSSTGRGRLDGFAQELGRVPPLTADAPLLGDFSIEFGRTAVRELLQRGRLPDAILCGADMIALGVVRELHGHNIAVPGEVLVTGFDGILFTELSDPPITTVRQPVEAIAQEVVSLLRRRLAGDRTPARRHAIAPLLEVRRSSQRELRDSGAHPGPSA